jgi:hypothetical protein
MSLFNYILNDDEGKFQKKIYISQIMKISSSSKSKGSEKNTKNINKYNSKKIATESKKKEQIKKRSSESKRNSKENSIRYYTINTTSERKIKESSIEEFNKEEKFPENKIKNFNLFHSISITFIYLLFGHFFIPVNIYLKAI